LLPYFITQLLDDQKVRVAGNGLHVRDWIHVDDHSAALLAVIEEGKPGRLYNIGGNNDRPHLEVVRLILDFLGKDESFIQFIADDHTLGRRYAVDCSRIERELRWEPCFDFAEGLTQTIEWYQANRNWWQSFAPSVMRTEKQKITL
jgi:dTDP-glucose 4,6-dehydratase